MAVQEDGKVLVGGMFTSLGGATRNYLGRLNRDGTLDTSFNPIVDGYVYTFAIQPDARILVGGRFTNLGGQPRMNLARLLPDGTLDASFDAGVMIENLYYTGMIDYYVAAIIVQADGRILVGGHFTTVGGQPRSNLARLDSDGSLDSSFNPDVTCNRAGTTPSVDSMVIQTDGSILLGGTFTTVAGQPRGNLARLRGDGVLDLTFNPVSSGSLSAVAVQTDGKILAGGLFSSLAGQAWKALGRLNYTVPATEDLRRDGSGITWLRGGSSPEVWRTTFEHTGDGIDWTSLGAGSRIIGGWQLTDVTPPAGGTVRARGFLASGYRNGSSWFVETLIGAPVFTTQPVSLTNNAGTAVTFSSQVAGPAPLSFQWLKDGVPLTDGAGVTGATSNTLALADVLKAAEASYCLVVTNANGSVTSLVATLTVVDPVLTSDPLSRYADPGQNMLFSVTAAGTALNYQWWKDGVALRQATEASLVLTNVQLSDAGNYRVVVSNQFGSLTSAVATLTVNLATLDSGFNPGAGGSVSAMAVQPDGKVLLGGAFTALGGQTRYRLGRLNADGTLDTGFSPQASATVHCLTVQRDGKILVGGDFGSLAGYSRSYIGRLNTNGTLDTSFTASLSSRAQAILIQPDGKIIVGGTNYVSRLNTNGTSDSSFKTTGGVNGPVTSLTFQSDGKIVAGGLFTSLRGQTRSRLGRLNADGSLDATFNPGVDKTVLALALQADGRILVGGAFTRVANQPRTNFARLYPDGTLDVDFAPAVTGSSSASIYSLAVQTDGRIVLGGLFTAVAGQPRLDCARLNPDGTIDAGFNPGANSYVYGLAIQGDGRILAGGNFTQFGGQSRSRVARLNNTEPATQELTEDGSTITWSRGGTSPEVRRTTFELATNGTNWTLLGAGIRNTSGWELAGVALPAAGSIRARGFVAGGANNGSSWFVETLLPLGATPQIILDDGGLGFGTNGFGFNLGGVPGQRVLVEISSNLVNWQPFRTNTLNTSLLYFSDSSGPNRPARFYRARLVP